MKNEIENKKTAKKKSYVVLIILFVFAIPIIYSVCIIIYVVVITGEWRLIITSMLDKEVDGAAWKEDVKLIDGSIIVVKRFFIGKNKYYHDKGNFIPEFVPKGNYIEVLEANGLPLPPPFISGYEIMIIDRNAVGEWFVIVEKTSYPKEWCQEHEKLEQYWLLNAKQYKLIDGEWKVAELDTSLEGREENLLSDYKKQLDTIPELITLSDKALFTSHNTYKVTFSPADYDEISYVCERVK